jgi:cyclophilin family peptidyl-prolyl cis-trans isomerase
VLASDAYGAGWDLAEWDLGSDQVHRVTSLPGDEWAPSINPLDGRIAYAWDAGEEAGTVVALGIGDPPVVLRAPAREAAFAADGELLFVLTPEGVVGQPMGVTWWAHPVRSEVAVGGLTWGRFARLDPEPALVVLETDVGRGLIRVDPADQPMAARQFLDLIDTGFYETTRVHRVSPGLAVQLGCPLGNGTGGAGPPLPPEPSRLALNRGRVAFEPEGAGLASSRLFIALDDLPHMDHPGAFGEVIEGMPILSRLLPGDRIRRTYRVRFDEADYFAEP